MSLAVESIVQAVLAEVSKSIVEKIRRGKRLSIEEILLLYLDLMHTQIGGLREEIRETNKRIDETNKRIDHVYQDLLSKIDQVYKDLAQK